MAKTRFSQVGQGAAATRFSTGYGTSPAPLGGFPGAQTLDQARVEIEPLKYWVSIANVRPSTGFKPKPQWDMLTDWAPIPDDAKKITVIIHGFNVSADDAKTRALPKYVKRLYWAGHPVLSRQGDDISGHAHIVGFSWPGNQGKTAALTAIYFPEDEFHAFQTGVPLSRFLKGLKQTSGRRVNVIAHSMGTLAMNSALMQPGMDGIVDTYIMNEAAVAAEAFDQSYSYSALERSELWPHAQAYGYSAQLPTGGAPCTGSPQDPCPDEVWSKEWADISTGQPCKPSTILPDVCMPDFTDLGRWQNSAGIPTDPPSYLLPRPRYDVRWGQQRPPGADLLPVDPVARST